MAVFAEIYTNVSLDVTQFGGNLSINEAPPDRTFATTALPYLNLGNSHLLYLCGPIGQDACAWKGGYKRLRPRGNI